jgi:hypothetical protein
MDDVPYGMGCNMGEGKVTSGREVLVIHSRAREDECDEERSCAV